MKLLEHTKSESGYKIRIWLDETKHDINGNPYPEWVFERNWGLDIPTVENEDGTKKPAMSRSEYEKSQVEIATELAKEFLVKLENNSEQVTAPKSL